MAGNPYRGSRAALLAAILAMLIPPDVPKGSSTIALPQSGVIIPLYTTPSVNWNEVIQAKQANPTLPFLVIVNPNNGPGQSQQHSFVQGVNDLKSAGMLVFGYVYTNYGTTTIAAISNQIGSYKSWYDVDGVFLDGMPNVSGYEAYYSSINTYAKSMGLYTIGNPGTLLPVTYAGVLDLYVLDEGPEPPTSSGPYPPGSTACMIHGVPNLTKSYVRALLKHSGFVYITDQTEPNPYNALPSYFASLVSMLSGAPRRRGSIMRSAWEKIWDGPKA